MEDKTYNHVEYGTHTFEVKEMKVKFIGNADKAKLIGFREYEWQKGEIKDIPAGKAKAMTGISNEFILVDEHKKEEKKDLKEIKEVKE